MIYAGFDIAKLNRFASVVSSDGEVLVEPFQFSKVLEGFRSLSLVLDRYDRDQLLIGLESTAHYGNNLVEFLAAKGYRLYVLNPIQTSSTRKKASARSILIRWKPLSSVKPYAQRTPPI